MGYEACYTDSVTLLSGHASLKELLLGPAYHDVEAGLVTVHTVWRPDAPIYPLWFPEKCNHAPRDWTSSTVWKAYAGAAVLYFLTTIPLCVLLYVHRREQFIRLRDFRQIFLTYATASVGFMVYLINAGMMRGSGSLRLCIYGLFMCTPYICFVYIIKLGQLLFIYYWNLAKVRRRTFETLHLFQRFKFVLGFKFVFACWTVWMVLGASIATVAVTRSSAFSHPGDRIFSSLRCSWYHIPDKYTVPTSNSTLCACLNRYLFDESKYAEECTAAVIATCVTGRDTSTATAGFCSACLPYITDSTELDQCVSWFVDFYLSGSCGFFRYTPDPSTTKVLLFADETFAGLLSGIVGVLSICGCILLVLVSSTKDEFGLAREFIVVAAGWMPALCFVTLLLSTSISDCTPGYHCWFKPIGPYKIDSINNFFYLLAVFYYSVVLLGFPVALVYIDKVVKHRMNLPRQIENSTTSTEPSELTMEPSSTFYTNDEREHEIEVCIRHPKLRAIYEQFAVQEFTAENITFLEDCRMLLDSSPARTLPLTRLSTGSESTKVARPSISSLAKLKSVRSFSIVTDGLAIELATNLGPTKNQKWIQSLKEICRKYIVEGSPMQVNLPHSIRSQLEASAEALTRSHDEGNNATCDGVVIDEGVANARKALASSYVEIRRLIARDSWPRFTKSRLFGQYSKLVQDERGIDLEMKRIYDPAPEEIDEALLTNTPPNA